MITKSHNIFFFFCQKNKYIFNIYIVTPLLERFFALWFRLSWPKMRKKLDQDAHNIQIKNWKSHNIVRFNHVLPKKFGGKSMVSLNSLKKTVLCVGYMPAKRLAIPRFPRTLFPKLFPKLFCEIWMTRMFWKEIFI